VQPARVLVGSEPGCRPTTRRDRVPMQVSPCAQSVAGRGGCQREAVFRSAGLRHGTMSNMPGRRPALHCGPLTLTGGVRAARARSVAVPGHSNGQMATRFCQSAAGSLCHIAVPGDGRTPAAGGKPPPQNFGLRSNAALPSFTLDFGLRALDFTLSM
jgi:hypothetical protein